MDLLCIKQLKFIQSYFDDDLIHRNESSIVKSIKQNIIINHVKREYKDTKSY